MEAIIVIAILGFYFLPSVIAMTRDAQHGGSIFLINLLFGWTILGWIAALIWACVEKPIATLLPAANAPAPIKASEPFYK